jgi:propanol-preferring alcohol dehydrogenase
VVEAVGRNVTTHKPGERVGIPWLGWSCGACEFCRAERENLCPNARYTGYQLNGGCAEYGLGCRILRTHMTTTVKK